MESEFQSVSLKRKPNPFVGPASKKRRFAESNMIVTSGQDLITIDLNVSKMGILETKNKVHFQKFNSD